MRCPQCKGTKSFMGQPCFTCEGKGEIDDY